MIVVGLPSAEVTSFKMVPAGSGPFVWEEEIICKQLEKIQHVSGVQICLLSCSCAHADPDLNDLCERVSGSLACYC